MAVATAKYVIDKGETKAHIRYIQNRRGKDGQKISRTLFDSDGAVERQEAYELIDESQKETQEIKFYKIMISPDPKTEDTDKNLNMWELTTKTIEKLEKQLQQDIQFVAAVHRDHKPHGHVHIVACIKQRLNREDLKALRLAATEQALFQRKELDLARESKAHKQEKAQETSQGLELSR